ncbi:hypothetical protein JW752_00940 [Candidatus Peregrinibacteria bacterium]|nr:hypothetical protein [Candidatus Peregrinibacteria bacterium]
MNTPKLIFGSILLVILMVVVVPIAAALIAVGVGFLLLIEDAGMPESGFGLGLLLFFASPITFIVLVGCLERELLTYWFRREDSALDLILG